MSIMKRKARKNARQPSVTIYSALTCPWCERTKRFLRENGIRFNEVNVIENMKARRDMIKKSGQIGVPVIEIKNKIIVGYDEEKLRNILKL